MDLSHDLFKYPIRPASWANYGRDRRGRRDYRITNHYDSEDILNGGKHRATDIGNARENDPVYVPGPCEVKGLRHWDGALGLSFLFLGKYRLDLWHLNRVDVPTNKWTEVDPGLPVGLTGSTGPRLPNGNPMPAHTHVELDIDGTRVDAEPYLLGRKEIPVSKYFTDVDNSKHADNIDRARELGLLYGVGDKFYPKGVLNRDQAATVMVRLYDKLVEKFSK